ncbi:hypothetical protein DPMN_051431 [Dreissena polymorpha]|uniref:Uncharacterized protein n=1 Tax=Dreissena polymorpha TaxID=45954 RepID=A0A9D4CJR6_DREPO|nr:hypothetical protein DPMN_051431 [Dreissena polymorpha]
MSSRLFTCFHYIHLKKTAPLPGAHVFLLITTIFKLVQDIHITNVLTKFYDDKVKNVTSRMSIDAEQSSVINVLGQRPKYDGRHMV